MLLEGNPKFAKFATDKPNVVIAINSPLPAGPRAWAVIILLIIPENITIMRTETVEILCLLKTLIPMQ